MNFTMYLHTSEDDNVETEIRSRVDKTDKTIELTLIKKLTGFLETWKDEKAQRKHSWLKADATVWMTKEQALDIIKTLQESLSVMEEHEQSIGSTVE